MANDTQILKEYLVALGFKVDENAARKFDNRLVGLDKRGAALGKTLVGVASAAVTLTTMFARSMERMYYSARYADTTVAKLQQIEYAGRQIGLAGGEATGAVKAMAAAVRANPGLLGLLEKLGVQTKGRTMDQVMVDFVKATKGMPSYVAQRYASMFGIDPETLFNLQQGLDQLQEFQRQRAQMAQDMGVNADEAARVAVEYMQMWRDLTENAGLFGQAILTNVMPQVKELMTLTKDLMRDWVTITREISKGGSEDFWKRIREGITGVATGGGVKLSTDAERRTGQTQYEHGRMEGLGIPRALEAWRKWRDMKDRRRRGLPTGPDAEAVDAITDNADFQGKAGGDAGDLSPGGRDFPSVDAIPEGALGGGMSRAEYLAMVERRYGLPPGILDRTWLRESGRGRAMRSPKGAQGHFGFMPKTAKEYGLNDPDDFKESAEAAGRKWRDLLKRYNGDARMAAAAYNWGDGNLARFGLGRAPQETRDYMDAVAGPVSVEQNTEVHVHGVRDPQAAADSVVRKQRELNGDLVRNLSAKVR